MNLQEAYSILGLQQGASPEEVKKSYRKLAHQHHPDKNPGNPEAEEKFKSITAAYELINNPPPPQPQVDVRDMWGSNPFEAFFGGSARGADHNINTRLTFAESALGCEKKLSYSYKSECSACEGTGGDKSSYTQCKGCSGSGVKQTRRGPNVVINSACHDCHGSGGSFATQCSTCSGAGFTKSQRTVDIKIPPGVRHGMHIRYNGQGGKSPGRPDGDLIVGIAVEPHPQMSLEGENVASEVHIPLKTALLGGEVEVETLHGAVKLKIPPCTRPFQKLALKDKGIPLKNGMSKHIVTINVDFPTNLTEEQCAQINNIL